MAKIKKGSLESKREFVFSRSHMKPREILREADRAGVLMSIVDIYNIRSSQRQDKISKVVTKGGVKKVVVPGKVRGIFDSLTKGAIAGLRKYFYQEFRAANKQPKKGVNKEDRVRRPYQRKNPGLPFGKIKFEAHKYLSSMRSAIDIDPQKIVDHLASIGIVCGKVNAIKYKQDYLIGFKPMFGG